MLSRLRIFGKPLISTCKDIGSEDFGTPELYEHVRREIVYNLSYVFFISNAPVIEKRLKMSWSYGRKKPTLVNST